MATNNPRINKGRSIDLSGRSIEVVVGPEPPVTFSVHESLIRASSDFFEKAMSGKWKESEMRSVRLESHDAEAFHIYLHWLYRRTLTLQIDEPGLPGNDEYLQLAKAYVLGDVLQDMHFKDAVLDAMVDKSCLRARDGQFYCPVRPAIRCIYDNTLESSKARRLLVDLYTYKGCGDWLWEDLLKEFLFDVAVAVLDKRPKPASKYSPLANECQYHEHTPENRHRCYRNHSTSTGRAPLVDEGQK